MKPGNPTGANQYSRGDCGNRGNNTDCSDRNDRNQQSGLLRRLAKQGRDDLLDRVASGELRKDFTPTERVAIAKAIEEEISRGHGGDRKSGGNQVVNRPLEKKSREVAAEKAGFGSEVTYRRAKKALDIFPAAVAN